MRSKSWVSFATFESRLDIKIDYQLNYLYIGELNQYVSSNKHLVTCTNILRYKLFVQPDWFFNQKKFVLTKIFKRIQETLYKLSNYVEEKNFILEFLQQCSSYVAHPEFIFMKEFKIGGSKIKFNDDMYYLDMVDYAFPI